jgi:hypothetical protein
MGYILRIQAEDGTHRSFFKNEAAALRALTRQMGKGLPSLTTTAGG